MQVFCYQSIVTAAVATVFLMSSRTNVCMEKVTDIDFEVVNYSSACILLVSYT